MAEASIGAKISAGVEADIKAHKSDPLSKDAFASYGGTAGGIFGAAAGAVVCAVAGPAASVACGIAGEFIGNLLGTLLGGFIGSVLGAIGCATGLTGCPGPPDIGAAVNPTLDVAILGMFYLYSGDAKAANELKQATVDTAAYLRASPFWPSGGLVSAESAKARKQYEDSLAAVKTQRKLVASFKYANKVNGDLDPKWIKVASLLADQINEAGGRHWIYSASNPGDHGYTPNKVGTFRGDAAQTAADNIDRFRKDLLTGASGALADAALDYQKHQLPPPKLRSTPANPTKSGGGGGLIVPLLLAGAAGGGIWLYKTRGRR